MNGRRAANDALLDAVLGAAKAAPTVEVVVCTPFPYLAQASAVLAGSSVRFGAQNCSEHGDGAFTGETSAGMLADVGCAYAIVGHSERRTLFGESDAIVAAKYVAVQGAGLTPILCLGESLAERESGVTEQVVRRQLDAVIERAGVASLARAVIAYEPVWAIGTGKTATAAQAQAVHAFLREVVGGKDAMVARGVRILYGGSVKPGNARELFAMPDIDGGLIGGAALVAGDFAAIVAAATE